MQKQQSPPKHRHDGTSPLPLGMDWSPPPRKWDGRDTVWPHDPRSGWSYCVTIPSWVTLPRSRDAEGVVYYRVQVGIQSPEGITTIRGVLRRFSDFMKLTTELKRTYPRKNLPPAPSKHILRINSNRSLPEERRCSLEEWMGKLLSDIDISRSVPVASILELEAAARSSFQDASQQPVQANPPGNGMGSFQPSSGLSVVGGSSSITDYGGDTTYETSEVKDLEVELQTTIEKNKENLQQAILIERFRLIQMQWDMEELRRKSLEMELKLKAEQDERVRTIPVVQEKGLLVQELDSTKEKLVKLQKLHEELQLKSKADTKVLVKQPW